MTGVI